MSVASSVSFPSPFALLGRALASIGNAFVNVGEANSRLRQVEALQALSDAELEERGIKRSEIVTVVFGAQSWL